MASRLLMAALVALCATPALAAPPDAGTRHTFQDPVFNGTIFCDSMAAVTAIATADVPDQVYANYFLTTNALDEPICMAIIPTGLVMGVTPIGVMKRSGHHFRAWAIETDVGGVTAFALYLERFEVTNV